MKALFKGLAILLVLLIVAVVVVAQMVSADDMFQQLSEQVHSKTNRTLSADGNMEMGLFPSLVLKLEKVRFANRQGGSKPDMMTMNKLDIHIPWGSLLSGELVIDKFVIDQPQILLETGKDGVPNWQLFGAAAVAAEQTTSENQSQSRPTGDGGGGLPDGVDVSLGQVEITNGSLTLIDHRTGKTTELSAMGLGIELPSLRKPLTVNGSVTYMGQKFDMQTVVDTPAKAINATPFELQLKLDSALVKVDYNGKIDAPKGRFEGSLKVNGDSVKDILAWQNQPMKAKDNAFNAFSLAADMVFEQNRLNLQQIEAKLDALAIRGSSVLTLSQVPHIELKVDLGELDVNPYLPDPKPVPEQPEDAPAQPIVWDDTPIDLSGLKAVNADIEVKSTSFMVRKIKLGKNRFKLTLNKGDMRFAMEEFDAYQGSGKGQVRVNATSRPYQIETAFNFDGIDAEPLLTDAAGFDKLMGKGKLNWNLTTKGTSQKDFVNALGGVFGINFEDGAVKGANLAAIARSAQNLLTGNLSGVTLDQDFDKAQKTDFASLTASFNFVNGVGTNQDLALLNPFVQVTGNGNVNLPATNTDMRINTKIVASMEGQASGADKSGLSLPIKIYGPFHKVKVKPDLSGGAKEKAKDKIKDKLKDKLKGLFG